MAVDIVASAGVFDADAEPVIVRRVFDALLGAIDAIDDEDVSSGIGGRALTNDEMDEGAE